MEYNYSSNAKGNLGVTLGAIGTGLSILNGGLGLIGGEGIANHAAGYVKKEEFEMAQKLASKDTEIALLKADNNVDTKLLQVYNAVNNKANEIYAEMRANQKEQQEVNTAQAVVNAQVAANLAVTQNNVASIQTELGSLTKTIIPISNVCPQPMPLYNSFSCPNAGGTTIS